MEDNCKISCIILKRVVIVIFFLFILVVLFLLFPAEALAYSIISQSNSNLKALLLFLSSYEKKATGKAQKSGHNPFLVLARTKAKSLVSIP